MKPRLYKGEGVVISRMNYGEGDRILTVYSRDYGKLSLMAKAVRKLNSRKRGAVEIFTLIKFSAARGKTLDTVTEAVSIDSFDLLRTDLKKASVAFFVMETLERLTREEERNDEMYDYLISSLKELEKTSKLTTFRKNFIEKSLIILGFWPKSKGMKDHDRVLESVTERGMSTVRVGKKLLA